MANIRSDLVIFCVGLFLTSVLVLGVNLAQTYLGLQ